MVLCFFCVADAKMSEERVAMRVLQGGHDVAPDRLVARFPRTLANLERAVAALPHVLVYDDGDLSRPFRKVAEFEHGEVMGIEPPVPSWLEAVAAGAPPRR